MEGLSSGIRDLVSVIETANTWPPFVVFAVYFVNKIALKDSRIRSRNRMTGFRLVGVGGWISVSGNTALSGVETAGVVVSVSAIGVGGVVDWRAGGYCPWLTTKSYQKPSPASSPVRTSRIMTYHQSKWHICCCDERRMNRVQSFPTIIMYPVSVVPILTRKETCFDRVVPVIPYHRMQGSWKILIYLSRGRQGNQHSTLMQMILSYVEGRCIKWPHSKTDSSTPFAEGQVSKL